MKYDLHIHSKYSACAALKPLTILKTAKKLNLDGIAITDHNSIKGALEVSKLNKDKNFEVIKGEEIATKQAHILGLYLNKEIKPESLFNVLEEIKKQNGIAIIAHPFGFGISRSKLTGLSETQGVSEHAQTLKNAMHFLCPRNQWFLRMSEMQNISEHSQKSSISDESSIFDISNIRNKIDAIETFNSRVFFPWENKKAEILAKKNNIAQTGGSDAHFSFEIGKGITIFDDDLRKAIKMKKTRTTGTVLFSYPGIFFSVFEKYLITKFK